MSSAKRILTCDCETDPFLAGRIPRPFVWGIYDGNRFEVFEGPNATADFVEYAKTKNIILYAHNGGKFDFMYLLPYIKGIVKAQIINGRIVSMLLGKCELRDSYSAIPVSLKDVKKDEIDYWKLERPVRVKHRDEIISYLRGDCVYLHELMVTYRKIAGTKNTIASNALAFSRKLGIKTGRTNWRFDSQMRRYYYGGRTQCFLPGTHHNIIMMDIHSCYPFAMMQDHATGSDFHWRDDLTGMTREQIQRAFITIECTSNGAFPKRLKESLDENGVVISEGGLFFPVEYNVFHVTGWEYLAALEFDLIKDVKIQSVGYTDETVNFVPYVDHWYDFKNRHSAKDSSGNRIFPNEYTVGKTMQNSLYGKMSQNPARYFDYLICDGGTPIDEKNGWKLGPEFEGHEIHQRPSLWKYQYELGIQWKAKGIYHNVATGASITGFARAHLLKAIHAVGRHNVIYTDTDSLFCREGTDISMLPQSDALGDWELEDARAPVGHFAGKKLYGVTLSTVDKKTGKNVTKIASKGSKLDFEKIERIMKGETILWESDAPSFSMRSGHIPTENEGRPYVTTRGKTIDESKFFVKRNIRATAKTVS